jgi:hypothetical protein
MKQLPKLPYLQNIVSAWHRQNNEVVVRRLGTEQYREYLRQFGFEVPIDGDYLVFPDDFSDEELLLFKLRWS